MSKKFQRLEHLSLNCRLYRKHQNMFKIGLSGSYHSGIEVVADKFKSRGTPVFDADVIMKWMINQSPKHTRMIKDNLGEDIYQGDRLDLRKFESNSDYELMLDCIELDLYKCYELWRSKNSKQPYTVFKSSVLFERSMNKSMNFNISVFIPKNKRRIDLMTNTYILSSAIDSILDGEMDELVKNSKADFIIHNYENGAKSNLDTQIEQINAILRNKVLFSVEKAYRVRDSLGLGSLTKV